MNFSSRFRTVYLTGSFFFFFFGRQYYKKKKKIREVNFFMSNEIEKLE